MSNKEPGGEFRKQTWRAMSGKIVFDIYNRLVWLKSFAKGQAL